MLIAEKEKSEKLMEDTLTMDCDTSAISLKSNSSNGCNATTILDSSIDDISLEEMVKIENSQKYQKRQNEILFHINNLSRQLDQQTSDLQFEDALNYMRSFFDAGGKISATSEIEENKIFFDNLQENIKVMEIEWNQNDKNRIIAIVEQHQAHIAQIDTVDEQAIKFKIKNLLDTIQGAPSQMGNEVCKELFSKQIMRISGIYKFYDFLDDFDKMNINRIVLSHSINDASFRSITQLLLQSSLTGFNDQFLSE